jgi:anthranilate synthase component 1
MNIYPSPSEFQKLAQQGNIVPVYADLMADFETPVSAYAKLSQQKPCFLFESIEGGEHLSRYTFMGFSPRKIVTAWEKETTIEYADGSKETVVTPEDPLSLIEEEITQCNPVTLPGMPPFMGGAVGYVGYEYVHRVESTVPVATSDELGMPVIYFQFTDQFVIFDRARQTLRICVTTHVGQDPQNAYEDATKAIEAIVGILRKPSTLSPANLEEPGDIDVPPGNFTQENFKDAVSQCKKYVTAGDIIQVVLSQRFKRDFEHSPLDLYRSLRVINPSPYMFLLETKNFALVGASPEVHVRLTGEKVEIRPIAGTRPRGESPEKDLEFEKDLLADEKECAEHLMLVDLARNDIGRVCKYGSIHVPEYMVIERYSHVMHIVSQVMGEIDPSHNSFDLLRATFPAGTVSGAPKVRAMQIISELEGSTRGSYSGALGYFGYDGNHDSCIGIRTALLKDGQIYIQSGAGIVADSVPENEYMETINKARGMLKAVALCEKFKG